MLLLDLRKIALSQGKSERAKTVLSEGKVALATLKEEKQFAAGRIWSGDGGGLRKSSLGLSGGSEPVISERKVAIATLNSSQFNFLDQ